MRSGKRVIYDAKITTTQDKLEEANKEFDQIIKNAPTANDYPDMTIDVRHTIEISDASISIDKDTDFSELLKKFGLQQSQAEKNQTEEPSNQNNPSVTLRF